MVLRLIPRSPRRSNSCCHRHWRIKANQTRSDLISPPPAWHQQRVSEPHGFAVRSSADHLARRTSLTRFISPCNCRCAPDALASTASRPALVTTRDPPLLSERDGEGYASDLGQARTEIFFEWRIDEAMVWSRLASL